MRKRSIPIPGWYRDIDQIRRDIEATSTPNNEFPDSTRLQRLRETIEEIKLPTIRKERIYYEDFIPVTPRDKKLS
ncbi:hypothetical protein JTB14_031284 [Gonioctena quinquepunctata]|nr:hypothetical protein JTB14_031284 [Gonioctena quinquepunctata]